MERDPRDTPLWDAVRFVGALSAFATGLAFLYAALTH